MRLSTLLAALALSLCAGTALAQNEPSPDQPTPHTEKAKPASHAKHKAKQHHHKASSLHTPHKAKTHHSQKELHKPADPADPVPHE